MMKKKPNKTENNNKISKNNKLSELINSGESFQKAKLLQKYLRITDKNFINKDNSKKFYIKM